MTRGVAFIVSLGLVVTLGSPAFAGGGSISAGNETIEGLGGSTTVCISTDATFELSGFSYGLCEPTGNLLIPMMGVSIGADAAATNGGGGPDFFAPAQAPDLMPGGQGDHTVGCVISFSGMDTLGAGINEVSCVTYNDAASVEALYPLEFCDTLGTPTVITTLVDAGGAGFGPNFQNGSVEVISGPPPYKFIAPTTTLFGMNGSIQLSISETADAGTQSQGFSFGLAIMGTAVTLTADSAVGVLADTNAGAGPDFIGSNLNPDNGPGYTAGVVVSFSGMDSLVVAGGDGSPVIQLDFDISGMGGENVPLVWTDTLGDPVVVNTVVVNGVGQGVAFCDGRIDIGTAPTFVRGDCNGDGFINIADGIRIICQFVSQECVPAPPFDCVEACDVNNDDMGPDVSDAVYSINHQLLDGPPPPAPFPDCGAGGAMDDCVDTCP